MTRIVRHLGRVALSSMAGLCIAVLSAYTPVLANPGTTVSVSPATVTVKAGDSFDVNVVINTDVASRGCQGALTFDSALFQVNSVTEGNFYKDWAQANGASTILFPQPVIDNAGGKVSDVGVAIVGGQARMGPVGNGVIVTYHMAAKGGVRGTGALALSDIVVGDASAQSIPGVVVTGGQATVQDNQAPVPNSQSPTPLPSVVLTPAPPPMTSPFTPTSAVVAQGTQVSPGVSAPTAPPAGSTAVATPASMGTPAAGAQSKTVTEQTVVPVAPVQAVPEGAPESGVPWELIGGIGGAVVVAGVVGVALRKKW